VESHVRIITVHSTEHVPGTVVMDRDAIKSASWPAGRRTTGRPVGSSDAGPRVEDGERPGRGKAGRRKAALCNLRQKSERDRGQGRQAIPVPRVRDRADDPGVGVDHHEVSYFRGASGRRCRSNSPICFLTAGKQRRRPRRSSHRSDRPSIPGVLDRVLEVLELGAASGADAVYRSDTPKRLP
jgi:hypothetical protein